MDQFTLARDLTISRLGFGAMRITGPNIIGSPPDESAAIDLITLAMDLGIDFIDTADSYGPGTSERLLRMANAPERAIVASKAGLLRAPDGSWIRRGDPDHLHNQVLCSLDRLGLETIDLYQFHGPDDNVPFVDSVHAFAEMKDRGQIRHVGLSNVTVDQLDEARDTVEIVSVQNRYNVADRADEPVLRACERAGIGFIPWGPLYAVDGTVPKAIRSIADELEVTTYQVALAWLLDHSPVMIPIPGTSNQAHLKQNMAASELRLKAQHRELLNGIDSQSV